MNKRGQTVMFAIFWTIIIFMVGVLIFPFIGDEVTRVTGSANLDCNNATISDGAKLTCLEVDIVIPAFLITVISIIGGIALTRLLMNK